VDLALSDLPGVDLEPLRGELATAGVAAAAVPADLADGPALDGLVRQAEEAVGPLDILVNNAGVEFAGPFERHSRAELESITAVNLVAVMELTRLVLPGMIERGRGHVVNVASLAGKSAVPYFTSYCATKHGVVGFTHALRAEHFRGPVGFSVICPAAIGRVGMYGRLIAAGAPSNPPLLGETPPERVGEAVVKAIRRDLPEVIASTRPARPMVVLAAAWPRAAIRLLNTRRLRRFADEVVRARGRM
jgi:short-subunit dehydrogenase